MTPTDSGRAPPSSYLLVRVMQEQCSLHTCLRHRFYICVHDYSQDKVHVLIGMIRQEGRAVLWCCEGSGESLSLPSSSSEDRAPFHSTSVSEQRGGICMGLKPLGLHLFFKGAKTQQNYLKFKFKMRDSEKFPDDGASPLPYFTCFQTSFIYPIRYETPSLKPDSNHH